MSTSTCCTEDKCTFCEADIESLPSFVNEFGKQFSICLACGEDFNSTIPESISNASSMSKKILKEVCIKSIVPELFIEENSLDESFPFCNQCTETKVARLNDLYRQLQVIQEEFDEIRSKVVQEIINTFVAFHENEERDGTKLFQYWKKLAGYLEEDDDFPQIKVEEVQQSADLEDIIQIKIEDEVDAHKWEENKDADNCSIPGDFPFDQNVLIPVVHLGNHDVNEPSTNTNSIESSDVSLIEYDFQNENYSDAMSPSLSSPVPSLKIQQAVRQKKIIKKKSKKRLILQTSKAQKLQKRRSKTKALIQIRKIQKRPPPRSKKLLKRPIVINGTDTTTRSVRKMKLSSTKESKVNKVKNKNHSNQSTTFHKRATKSARTKAVFNSRNNQTTSANKSSNTVSVKNIICPSKPIKQEDSKILQLENPQDHHEINENDKTKTVPDKIKSKEEGMSNTDSDNTDTSQIVSKSTPKSIEKPIPQNKQTKTNKYIEIDEVINCKSLFNEYTSDNADLYSQRKRSRPPKVVYCELESEDSLSESESVDIIPEIKIKPLFGRPKKRPKECEDEDYEAPLTTGTKAAKKRGRGRPRGSFKIKENEIKPKPEKKVGGGKRGRPRKIKVEDNNNPNNIIGIDDEMDLTMPKENAAAFSTLLSFTVRSLLDDVDGDPIPKQNDSLLFPLKNPFEPQQQQNLDNPPKVRKRRENIPRQCEECGKMLISTYNLKLHMRTHTLEKPYSCPDCSMSFYKPENLKAHSFKHSGERPLECEICNARFSYPFVLRSHKASQHGIFESDAIFECLTCSKRFLIESDFNKHIRNTHQKGKNGDSSKWLKIYCKFCNATFDDPEALKEHQKTKEHLEAKGVAASSTSNKETQSKISSTSVPLVSCNLCDSKFYDYRLLKNHKRKAHPENFYCELCKKNFSSAGSLKTHLIIHLEDKPFVCDVCGDKFNTKTSLNKHESKKHSGGGIPYTCQYCSKEFTGERTYRKHLCKNHSEVHLKEKFAVCEVCYLNFATNEELKSHMEIHADLVCKECGKGFGYKNELKKHLLNQGCSKAEMKVEHKCNFCDSPGFLTITDLKEHIQNEHESPALNFNQQYAVLSHQQHADQLQDFPIPFSFY